MSEDDDGDKQSVQCYWMLCWICPECGIENQEDSVEALKLKIGDQVRCMDCEDYYAIDELPENPLLPNR